MFFLPHLIKSATAEPPAGKFNIYSPVYQQQAPHACVVTRVNVAAWMGTEEKCLLSGEKLCNHKLDLEMIT